MLKLIGEQRLRGGESAPGSILCAARYNHKPPPGLQNWSEIKSREKKKILNQNLPNNSFTSLGTRGKKEKS